VTGLQPPNIAPTSAAQIVTNAFVTANWTNGLTFLLNRPLFIANATATQTVTTGGSGVPVLFDTEVTDTYNGHSTTSNTSRYVGQAPGWYRVSGSIPWSANTSGSRKVWVAVNGVQVAGSVGQIGPAPASELVVVVVPSTMVQLNGTTDYVEIWVQQDSGSSLTVNPNGSNQSGINIIWEHL
jgi:hypothetical protein